MTKFYAFEDMNVWQEARSLTRIIRAICKRSNAARDFAFVDQITRSVRSISANIAEGSDAMTSPEFIVFLGYAKRSAAEVRSHLFDALDEKYITQEEFTSLAEECRKVQRMIASLIHHLQTLDPKLKRTFKQKQPVNQLTS